jgi:2-polyprenyl-6-methoxyphenol hydroxylase-like FAD-dependent oxidoreductase
MLDALPAGMLELNHRAVELVDSGQHVSVRFENDTIVEVDVVVGADGIGSFLRTCLWGEQPIRHEGKNGYEWWVLEACDPQVAFTEDLLEFAKTRAKPFSQVLRSLIDNTPREHLQRWEIRDRPPLGQWSKGRVTLLAAISMTIWRCAQHSRLTKIVGDATPGHILQQLAEIEGIPTSLQ